MEWVYKKVTDSWTSTQDRDDVKLMVSLMGSSTGLVKTGFNLIIIDLEDTKENIFFSMGKEKPIEDIESKKKDIEEILDYAQYEDVPREQLFEVLQSNIIKNQSKLLMGLIPPEEITSDIPCLEESEVNETPIIEEKLKDS